MPSWRSSSASISCRVMCGFLFLFRRHSAVVTSVLQYTDHTHACTGVDEQADCPGGDFHTSDS